MLLEASESPAWAWVGPSHLCFLELQASPQQPLLTNDLPEPSSLSLHTTGEFISFPVFSLPTPSPPTGCEFHSRLGNAHANSITRQPVTSQCLAHSISRRAGDVAQLLEFMKPWVPNLQHCINLGVMVHTWNPSVRERGRCKIGNARSSSATWVQDQPGMQKTYLFLKNPRKIDPGEFVAPVFVRSSIWESSLAPLKYLIDFHVKASATD